MNAHGGRAIAALATLAMLGAVVAGLAVIGSPAQQRRQRLDERLIADLRTLALGIQNYWEQHKALPATLAELHPRAGTDVDPVSGTPYGYAVTGPGSFRLCAVFALPSPVEDMPADGFSATLDWRHPAGAHCFDGDVHATPKAPLETMRPGLFIR